MSSERSHDHYIHDALFYHCDEELAEVAVPFLRAAQEAGEKAVLVCRDRNTDMLTEHLDGTVSVGVLGQTEVYRRIPDAVAAYQRLVDRELAAGARGVRVVGEVDFGTNPADWAEWARYEAVCNRALAPYPLWSVCAYDVRALPPEVVTAGEATHPNLVTTAARRPNPRYLDPTEFLRRSARSGPHPLEHGPPVMAARDVTDLSILRHRVRTELARSDLRADVAESLVVAISEVTTNAFVHGHPPVDVQLWWSGGRALCAITDHGTGIDDPYVGYEPANGRAPRHDGLGLWVARQLCDQVDITPTAEGGFTIRLVMGR